MNPILRANVLYGRCSMLGGSLSRISLTSHRPSHHSRSECGLQKLPQQQQQQQQQQLRIESPLLPGGLPFLSSQVTMTVVRRTISTESFFERQRKHARPISPHLSIYKPQFTWMLSITHRLTGFGMACALYGFAINSLLTQGHFADFVSTVQAMHLPAALIVPTKLLTSATFFLHYFNGIRHLAWDLGIGFELKEVHTSAKIVMGATALASLYATFAL